MLRVLGQRAPEVATWQVLRHQHDLPGHGAGAQELRARTPRVKRARSAIQALPSCCELAAGG